LTRRADSYGKVFVYVITCAVNGKRYVGKSCLPAKRWANHQRCAKRGVEAPLYGDMREYGVDAFEFEIVQQCESESASYDAECEWIAKLASAENGYNRYKGGQVADPVSGTKARAAGNRANGKKAAVLARAVELYGTGLSLKEIGAAVGRTGERVLQLLVEAGVHTPAPRGGEQAKARDARILELRSQRMTMEQIATELRVSVGMVHRVCAAAGSNARLN
jgi:hypothetical protein